MPDTRRDVTLTRDSVCMADDFDAPHARRMALPAGQKLADALLAIATGYLPHVAGAPVGWRVEAYGRTVGWLVRRNAAFGRTLTDVRGVPADAVLGAGNLHFHYVAANAMATRGPPE